MSRGAMTGGERIEKRNVLALPTQVLMDGGLCSFSWLNRYVEYLNGLCPKNKIIPKGREADKDCFGNAHGRVSLQSTVLPLGTTDSFRPVRV